MRNKPQVAAFYEKPNTKSLSPHYKRLAQIKQSMNDFSDYPMSKKALINARIELNHLANRSQRRVDLGVSRERSSERHNYMDKSGSNPVVTQLRSSEEQPSIRKAKTGLRRRRIYKDGSVGFRTTFKSNLRDSQYLNHDPEKKKFKKSGIISNQISLEISGKDGSAGARWQTDRDSLIRHSSLKPTKQVSLMGQQQPSVKFKIHEDSSKNLFTDNQNISISIKAKESHFNDRYNDYLRRIKEVN